MPYRSRPPKDPRKKKRRWPLLLLLLLLLPLVIPVVLVFVTLGKINRDIPIKEIDRDMIVQETIDKTGHEDIFAEADEDIRENFHDVVWSHADVTNVLIAGIDLGDGGSAQEAYARSDAMLLLSANRRTKTVSMVSLLRTVYAAIPGFPNTRLNMAHAYGGPRLLVETVESNYKVKIDHFMTVDFDGFARLVDILGGVTIPLSAPEWEALVPFFPLLEEGVNELNGAQALAYSRLRWIDSDLARTQRQRNVLEQLAAKARGMSLGQFSRGVDAILPLVTTDMSSLQLIRLLPYAAYKTQQSIMPNKQPRPVRVGNVDVLIIDWKTEVRGLHELLYPGLLPE
ncbi:MAG: LCP family protein [Oscillospiraceae bacterium]|nr:LCP family protein [Oscillospiraceae bacterium]